MSSTTRTKLPVIFSKGQPANLHDMSLNQLRKFVPFLILCETGNELPSSVDDTKNTPPWWPAKLPFSSSILDAKLPAKEQIGRLVKIVSLCYAYNNCSYLIALSTSLAPGGSFGNVTFVQQNDGTTKILSGNNQLSVMIRTSTRDYDRKESNSQQQQKHDRKESNNHQRQKRRSGRITNNSIIDSKTVATFLEESLDSGDAMKQSDGSPPSKRRRKNLERACRSKESENKEIDIVKVVGDITNQIRTPRVKQNIKGSPSGLKSEEIRGSKRSRYHKEDKLQDKILCKNCPETFQCQKVLNDHEKLCGKSLETFGDTRDNPSNKDNFMRALGLLNSVTTKELTESKKNSQAGAITNVEPEAKPVRALRKVFSRSKIGAAIKNHPLPITSERGQQLLTMHGERKTDGFTVEYEKYCTSKVTKVPLFPQPAISTLQKHRIKEYQYTHSYSFSKVERITRNVELVVGLVTKNFGLLNQCKRTLRVAVERLPKSIVEPILKRDRDRKLERQRKMQQLVKKRTLIIQLVDFRKHPDSVPSEYKHYLKKKL